MDTVESIIVAMGGPAQLGRVLGCTTEHIVGMRRRRSIPVSYWPSLIEAARLKGIELDEAKLVQVRLAEEAVRKAS